jgi:uncharacterized RDD family membrane protein YckC
MLKMSYGYGVMVEPNESMRSTNPFEAPSATPEGQASRWEDEEVGARRLAPRGTRLAGAMVDWVLYVVAAIPGLIIAGVSAASMSGASLGVAAVFLGIFCLAVYQWGLIVARGQSLGKRWLRMKIVKLDGTPVDFVSGVLLRSWVVFALSSIPLVGALVVFVDWLMIFGTEQRCLHDRIAGTTVIDVTPH